MNEIAKKKSEKYCIVPKCHNTTVKAPNKLYFSVPKKENLRKKWCNAMKRDEKKKPSFSNLSTLYCCEDHFNLERDLQNFCEFKLMENVRPRLKKNTVPHIFECQKASRVPLERKGTMKRKRKQVVEETTLEVEKVPIETVTSEISTSKTAECGTYFQSEIVTLPLPVRKRSKGVQTNIKLSFRSKAVNTIKTQTANKATCPWRIRPVNISSLEAAKKFKTVLGSTFRDESQ